MAHLDISEASVYILVVSLHSPVLCFENLHDLCFCSVMEFSQEDDSIGRLSLTVSHWLSFDGSNPKKLEVFKSTSIGRWQPNQWWSFGGAGVVPPKSDRLTLSERSILLSDTRSQVKTMTNEAVGGWETSNRQMRSRL